MPLAAARMAGADDQALHDTELIAAALCIYNRYLDGLATWIPSDPAVYDRIGERRGRRHRTVHAHQLAPTPERDQRTGGTRILPFPASVEGFTIVRPDCGYAVGAHGMVYRYRVVPVEYTSKGMIAAPAMSAK